jgi:hypothetical protein
MEGLWNFFSLVLTRQQILFVEPWRETVCPQAPAQFADGRIIAGTRSTASMVRHSLADRAAGGSQ